jgi:SMODS and SLOG-associating 2TM effector domain family 5
MLSDKIWITRKTRIYAEMRLQRNGSISQLLLTLYSLAVVSLSIWNLQNDNHRFNLISIFASVVVLVLSVIVTSQHYAERSISMRNCYVKLDELYSKAKRAEAGKNNKMIQQLESEYTGLLINIENHSDYDYLCLQYSQRKNPNTTLPLFTKQDHARFIWENLWRGTLIILSFFLAIGIIVFPWTIS